MSLYAKFTVFSTRRKGRIVNIQSKIQAAAKRVESNKDLSKALLKEVRAANSAFRKASVAVISTGVAAVDLKVKELDMSDLMSLQDVEDSFQEEGRCVLRVVGTSLYLVIV